MSCVKPICYNSLFGCPDELEFSLPLFYANKNVELNVTGRSKRIYRFTVTCDSEAKCILPVSELPTAYFSPYSDSHYIVYFVDLTTSERIEFDEIGNCELSFKYQDVVSKDLTI